MLRAVFVDGPLQLYAYADTGALGARALMIGGMLAVMGLGAGIGAGIAALGHRDPGVGAAVGMGVAGGAAIAWLVLMLALLLGATFQAWAGPRPPGVGTKRRSRHRARAALAEDDDRVPWLWVGAAFFGMIGAFVTVVSGAMAIGEFPFRGPRGQSEAEVLDWDDSARGDRMFTVRFVAEGEQRTAEVKVGDSPDLSIDTAIGDRLEIEYQLDDPNRVRGLGQGEEMRSTVLVSAWAGAAGLAVAAACAGLAWLTRPPATDERPG